MSNIKIDVNSILQTGILTLVIYVCTTMYNLDKSMALQEYKIDQVHVVLQMLSEEIDKK